MSWLDAFVVVLVTVIVCVTVVVCVDRITGKRRR